MYAVSEEYLRQMNKPDVRRVIAGTIGDISFTAADIIKGSLHISNQCSESGKITLGSVYTAIFECTFRRGLVDRETWKGLEIIISEGICLEDGETIEYVPLGVFYVDEAVHVEKGVSVKAYDAMLKFEKTLEMDTTYGSAYSLTRFACNACGVELGITEEEFELLPNGDEDLVLYTENDLETWRDMLFWIGQTCCGFWTINRSGQLVLRSYGMTVRNIVPSELRDKNASFSDFVTEYTAVSLTNKSDDAMEYYSNSPDDKLTYDLGANPFIQYGNESDHERKCRNILNALSTIEYVPFMARVLCGAPYDLGDVIRLTGGRAEDSRVSCIMFWDFDCRGYDLEGFGTNPATAAAKTKTDKAIQNVMSSSKGDAIQFYLFTNSEGITVEDGDTKKIIDIRFASNKSTVVIFQAEIICDVATTANTNMYDAVCTVKYRYNDVYLDSYQPKETWVDGDHMLHLLYFFSIQSAQEARLEVMLNMTGGRVVIPMNGIRSSVYGQALAASDRWDGTIDIRQEIERIDLDHPGGITTRNVITAVSVDTQTPIPNGCTQEIPVITLGKPTHGLLMRGVSDGLLVDFTEV